MRAPGDDFSATDGIESSRIMHHEWVFKLQAYDSGGHGEDGGSAGRPVDRSTDRDHLACPASDC